MLDDTATGSVVIANHVQGSTSVDGHLVHHHGRHGRHTDSNETCQGVYVDTVGDTADHETHTRHDRRRDGDRRGA